MPTDGSSVDMNDLLKRPEVAAELREVQSDLALPASAATPLLEDGGAAPAAEMALSEPTSLDPATVAVSTEPEPVAVAAVEVAGPVSVPVVQAPAATEPQSVQVRRRGSSAVRRAGLPGPRRARHSRPAQSMRRSSGKRRGVYTDLRRERKRMGSSVPSTSVPRQSTGMSSTLPPSLPLVSGVSGELSSEHRSIPRSTAAAPSASSAPSAMQAAPAAEDLGPVLGKGGDDEVFTDSSTDIEPETGEITAEAPKPGMGGKGALAVAALLGTISAAGAYKLKQWSHKFDKLSNTQIDNLEMSKPKRIMLKMARRGRQLFGATFGTKPTSAEEAKKPISKTIGKRMKEQGGPGLLERMRKSGWNPWSWFKKKPAPVK